MKNLLCLGQTNMINKTLVVYYSLEGSTKLIAEDIAESLGADILECKPKKEINSKGFMKYIRGGKQAIMKKEPEIEELDKDPNDYDVIVIGTPVWAYSYTPVIRTFFTKANLNNKKVAVFCTHEGGKGKTIENMKERLQGNTLIGESDFMNVKKDPENNLVKAKKWSLDIKSQVL